jgi:hypothetical protein
MFHYDETNVRLSRYSKEHSFWGGGGIFSDDLWNVCSLKLCFACKGLWFPYVGAAESEAVLMKCSWFFYVREIVDKYNRTQIIPVDS